LVATFQQLSDGHCVIPYEALITTGGEKEAKAAGKMRLESKDYVVQEGDVILFRHSR
jgi:ribosome-binding ATPase YchF (GTP1/OBG family)